jgi:hypothetical protein
MKSINYKQYVMSFFKLCPDDELINTLQGVFNANIVRVPEARIQPMTVIALSSRKPSFWGYLNELLETSIQVAKSAIQESRMADISGKKSKSVSVDVGLQVLQGFIGGFGLPSSAITTKFMGARTVSFSFQEVIRYFISPSQLGNLLQGHALDVDKASNTVFFRNEAQLLVVDSVITSKDFSITVESLKTKDFTLDIPAIEKMVGQAKVGVQVTSNSGLDLRFKGETALTFAFTCLVCELDEAGRIALKPTSAATHFDPNQSVEHKLLFDEPSMIELDNQIETRALT